MTWSLAILDAGITNATLARLGKSTVYEFDFLGGDPETDNGVVKTHANDVFKAALNISYAIDFLDLKIGNQTAQIDPLVSSGLQTLLSIGPTYNLAAINMSFSAGNYPLYASEIAALAAQGVITVAAAGNDGSHDGRESLPYPARLPGVIAVGSHDGHGRPTDFSNNGPGVDILADGENFPSAGRNGTSFAAPQVAATVTHVQAIVDGLTGNVLNVAQMVDVLQQGGAGPRSKLDPADGQTRYFLHDHDGSLDYAWSRYGGSPARALEYVASHGDLINALGADARAGQLHFELHGSVEERPITFDGLDYIASYDDLISAFGVDPFAGASHFISAGVREGRAVSFDGLEYIASYDDLIRALGANEPAGATHFIAHGRGEGRQTSFDGLEYIASHADLIRAFGVDASAGTAHFIGNGLSEGRARDLFDAAQYLAKHADLRAAFGSDEVAATQHFVTTGYFEGRTDATGVALTDFLV